MFLDGFAIWKQMEIINVKMIKTKQSEKAIRVFPTQARTLEFRSPEPI